MQSHEMTLNDGWHNTTLKVSGGNSVVSSDPNYPIAPPRRKRSSLALSTILIPDENKPGGFKEVFGDLSKQQNHHSDSDLSLNKSNATNDFTDFSKDLSNDSTNTIISDVRSLKRRISKVGNKKSDKFFGENLSDCLSDEPIVNDSPIMIRKFDDKLLLSSGYESSQSSDAIDDFVQENVDHSIVSIDSKPIKKQDEHSTSVQQKKVSKMTEEPPPPPISINVEILQNESSASSPLSNIDKRSSMDKRAEFLMTLLEGYNKDTKLSTIEQNQSRDNETENQEERALLNDIEKQIKPITGNASPTKTEKRVNFAFQQESSNKNYEPVDEVDFYINMKPVDEPIIVPKRKVYKHICHDDDHLHDAINAAKLESLDAEHNINSPKKPARDFSKYAGKSKTLPNGNMKNLYAHLPIEKPIRRNKKNISRDNLPVPPPAPISQQLGPIVSTKDSFTVNNIENVSVPSENAVNSLASCEKIDKKPDPSSLRKCNSSQSFLTKDVMAGIVNKVYDFDFDWNQCDDGSTQGLPVSTVTTRSISPSRQEREKLQKNDLNKNGFALTNPFKDLETSVQSTKSEPDSNDKLISNVVSVDERNYCTDEKELEKLAEFSIGDTEITVSIPNLGKNKIVVNDFLAAERQFSLQTYTKTLLNHLSESQSSTSDESIPSTIETVIMNPLRNSDSSVSGFGTTTVNAIDAIEMSKNPSGIDVKWDHDQRLFSNDEQNKIVGPNKRRSSEYGTPSKYEQKLTVPRRSLDSCDQKQLSKVFVVPEIKITTDADTSNAADHSVLLKFFNDSI